MMDPVDIETKHPKSRSKLPTKNVTTVYLKKFAAFC